MRAFFIQISGLLGLICFFNHLWINASLERTLFVSFGVALAVYFVLSISESIIRRIMITPVPKSNIEEANIKEETSNKSKEEETLASSAKA